MGTHDSLSTPSVSCGAVRTTSWQILNSRSETTFPPTPFPMCSEKKNWKTKKGKILEISRPEDISF